MDFPRICPARWFSDPDFGMCMPREFMYPFYDIQSSYYRPWKRSNQNISKEFGSTIENDKGNYKITLDVQHFRPNDISVKVSEKEIIIEGKHEERPDAHGFVSRQFMRRYPLPSHCPADNVTSSLSSDGILTIIALKQTTIAEKIVPIKMCGVCPKNTIVETKIAAEASQKSLKENFKETEDITSKNKSQIMLKEEHSRLLKPELLGEAISETNGEKPASKQVIQMDMSEKKSAVNMGATTNMIEETLAKYSLGLAECTEQLLGQVIDREMSEKKGAVNMGATLNKIEEIDAKSSSGLAESKGNQLLEKVIDIEKSEQKSTSNLGSTSSKTEESIAKSSLGLAESKEHKQKASTSEMCSMKGMSHTRIEESSSSYKSSSTSMSSTIKSSGKLGECLSDIISAELREAAENV
ncbi:heat shock protein 67B1-like [Trichoplusia ni]|uniref:Heat shock protein 67B1-like n=1 Tax=Trichoplusia ni TaxID=7111 RepID=A0A7E5VKY7_TRINI|nr:heat shock protein 67B1-like [Trichoplusia ni]